MKKLIIVPALILLTGITFGQKLKKGNLIGTHVSTIELNPGVTMEQFLDLYTKLLPKYEKAVNGWKFYMTKGMRGENENSYGLIVIIESEEARDQYYDDDGIKEDVFEKWKTVDEELNKLGKTTTKYTDWLIL